MKDRRWVDAVTARYYKEIFCYCRRHVSDDDTAYELTQEVFLRFCEQYQNVGEDTVRAWLYRVAHHLCVDYYRAENRTREWTVPMPADLADTDADTTAGMEDPGISETETADLIADMLSRLNEGERALYRERHELRLSYREMAERRNSTEPAIRTRMSRLHKKLERYVWLLFHMTGF